MENVKKNLRSVLLSKVGGVPLKSVEKDYKNLVGEQLNWRQYGFGSFEAFLSDIPDVVKVAFKKDSMYAFGIAENMSYINPTARKAQFKETLPKNGTCSKEGNTGNRTVYIGHLPLRMTEETLKSFLSAYLVLGLTTIKHHDGTSAWVITTRDDAERMCSELNRKRYDNQALKVEIAHRQSTGKKRDFPAKPSARESSSQSTAASVNSNGDSSSLRTQASKNNKAIESLNSEDAWSKSNGVEEPKLRCGFAAEPYEQQSSRPDFANSVSVSTLKVPACNYDCVQPSSLLVLKNSTSVSEIMQFADYEEDDSDFLWNGSSEPPPLVDGGDWEVFEQGTSSQCFNGQRGYSSQTRNEPPPLFSRNNSQKLQQKNEISSSTNSWPSNTVLRNEQLGCTPYEGETFNLYVKNIPLGTMPEELYQLFKNAVKIVGLSKQSCFAVFRTIEEVEDACRRSWMIRNSPIYVDVASKHKQFCSEPDGFVQPTRDEAQFLDLSTGFENLTCTVGRNNERKVQLCAESSPTETDSDVVSQTQATGNSNMRETLQQRSLPMAHMPPLVSRADLAKSRVNVQPAADYVVPPLLSMEELAKIREYQLSQKSGGRSCNSETIDQDLPASTCNGANSKQLYGALNSQDSQAAARRIESSRQLHDFSDFDGDYQTANRKSVRSNSRQHLPKSFQVLPSAKEGNSSEVQSSSKKFAEKVMPVLKQHDRSDFYAKFQPSSDLSEWGDIDGHDCTPSLDSQLAPQGAPSVSPLKPIPDEMRLKELQRMLMDTFPGDTLPTSCLLPDVVSIVIICAVPGFENSFFWGQLASDAFETELQKMYDLIPRMEAISGSLSLASAFLRRGATKYGEDWCRVWIKLRGETTSTVFFIDFGNFETVSNDKIYELPEEFWKVRPTALPFRVLDSGKLNISQHINQRVAAKVNKKCQRGCIFEIYDLQAQS